MKTEITKENLAPVDCPESLVVVSKVKGYCKARSAGVNGGTGFNTSDAAMPALSGLVGAVVDLAILSAARDGRKTVLDRDIAQAIQTLKAL